MNDQVRSATSDPPRPDHASVWDEVIGQARAIEQLRAAAVRPVHAYLLLGPSGSTKHAAARAFATMLLTGEDTVGGRDAELIRRGEHPDVREIERVGAAISAEQAREIVRLAQLAPVERERKVLILHEFHLLRPEGAALLLKTLEEPPGSTVFLVLADFLDHDLITIASRCTRVIFRSIADGEIADRLVLEGTDPTTAEQAAAAAGGDLTRARILASDPELSARRRAFAEVPYSLDGTGAIVMRSADRLMGLIDAAAEPLAARHAEERTALEERVARLGERGSGRKALEDRHKRELRRHRTDELRAGLAQLAGSYRDALVTGGLERPESAETAVFRIHQTLAALDRNPNEALALQALLWALPPLPTPDV